MDSNLTKATDNQLQQYEEKLISQQTQAQPAKYNTIKIWYDDEIQPENLGKFVCIKEGETEWTPVGDSFKATVLAKRHQYNYFDEDDKTNNMRTSQFEDWGDLVDVYVAGDMKEQVRPVAKWMKENYSKEGATPSTYVSILYVLYKDAVYLLRVKGASCSPYFDYVKLIDANKTSFSFESEFGHGKEKKGTVTYYPMTFKALDEHKTDKYKELLSKSFEVDNMIADLNNPVDEGKIDMVKEAEGAFEKKDASGLPF